MKQAITELEINGTIYVPKDSIKPSAMAISIEGLPFVIVAAGIGGIHFGYLKERKGMEVTLINSRRIQYWDGAASISEMAVRGVSKPASCRFAPQVPEITLTQAVEIIPVCESAMKNLILVPVWTR
jgi:hypothetical protein